jgi:hypothetical protein
VSQSGETVQSSSVNTQSSPVAAAIPTFSAADFPRVELWWYSRRGSSASVAGSSLWSTTMTSKESWSDSRMLSTQRRRDAGRERVAMITEILGSAA